MEPSSIAQAPGRTRPKPVTDAQHVITATATAQPHLDVDQTAQAADQLAQRKLARKLRFTIEQCRRNTLPVWGTCVFISYPAWAHAPVWIWFGWVALAGASYMARNRLLREGMDLAVVEQAPQRWMSRLFWGTCALGLVVAAGPSVLFPYTDDVGRMFITMLLSCWLAMGMSSLGAWPRLFSAYIIIFTAGMMLAWLVHGDAYKWQTVSLLGLQSLMLAGFVRNFSRQFDEGIDMRFANEALVLQLTQAREAAEKASEAKSRFLAVASHDLRQPLHAVTLLNGMLSRAQPQERVTEISRLMGQSLGALANLFGSVLDFSKIEAQRVTPNVAWQPLAPLFKRLETEYGLLASQKGLRLFVDVPDLDVLTDGHLFERVLRNLLDNALKFTVSGSIRLQAVHGHLGLRVSVIDSGPGVPANLREDVFKEYFQAGGGRAGTGLGLGLAIVSRLCALLDMEVAVRDASPQGTCFDVSIKPEQVRPAQAPSPENYALGGGTAARELSDLSGYFIVYVEDDTPSREALELLLRDWGCRVVAAASLEQALALLEGQGAPDAVLSDYQLAHGGKGTDAIEELRRRYGPVSGAILTAESTQVCLQLSREIEYPVLGKPVAPQELRALLEVFKGIG